MNRKYSIGFFVAAFFAVIGMNTVYQMNYNQEKQALLAKEVQPKETVEAKGTAKKENTFYMTTLNGYVVVYLSDQTTVYEYTNILVSTLPESLQTEIQLGKIIENTKELYGFLESYSS
ncbi:MAG: hypothetical protein RR869_02145 [Lachnospiraceae bacterium]